MVDRYVFDSEQCDSGLREYIPNVLYLNKIIECWFSLSISFCGIVHSHLDSDDLSYADIEYAKKIITNNDLDSIIMGIYNLRMNKILMYKVMCD